MASLRTGFRGLSSGDVENTNLCLMLPVCHGSRDDSQVVVTHPISDLLRLQTASLCVGHLFCLAETELPSCTPWER